MCVQAYVHLLTLPDVAAEGWRIRSMMMSYAEALSHKGHMAPQLIFRLREDRATAIWSRT